MECTAVLLAGGKSSRMGRNKALLPIGGTLNISRIADELQKATNEVLIITNSPEDYRFLQLPLIPDIHEGLGPMAGLQAGMSSSQTDLHFLTACDMPFIQAETAKEILGFYIPEIDAVIPEINGRLQPLFAVYHKRCLPVLSDCLLKKELKMTRFLEKIRVKVIKETDFKSYHQDPERFSHLFFNMNTMEDYQQAGYINETEFNKGW